MLSQPTWKIEPIIASIDSKRCKNVTGKCGICVSKCPYGAIKVTKGQAAMVTSAMCHGCGTCVAECPSDAITHMHFTDEQIKAQIKAALEDNPEEKILGFLCNWCSYAGADLAGTSRFEYPPTMRAIRVMCSGRVDPLIILRAFQLGADGFFVGGCHPGDCHYISGNYHAKDELADLKNVLAEIGINPDRLRLEWVSASEGKLFADIMTEFTEQIHALGPIDFRKKRLVLATQQAGSEQTALTTMEEIEPSEGSEEEQTETIEGSNGLEEENISKKEE